MKNEKYKIRYGQSAISNQQSAISNNCILKASKAVLFAVLAFTLTDAFGADFSNTNSTREKTVTNREAKKFYAKLPLHYAVWKRDKDLLLKQIEKYGTEDIDTKAENGRTPLTIAALSGDVNIAKILVKNGAKVDLKSGEGNTPLRLAVYNGYFDMVKYLVKGKADVTAVDNLGFTPLMTAANRGHVDIVKYLIKNKKVVNDIDHQSKKGNTALIIAAMRGNADIVKLLIDAGADVDIENNKGETALSEVEKLNKKLNNLLKKAGAKS